MADDSTEETKAGSETGRGLSRKERLEQHEPNRCIQKILLLPKPEYQAVWQSTRVLMKCLADLGAGIQTVSIEDLVRGISKRERQNKNKTKSQCLQKLNEVTLPLK